MDGTHQREKEWRERERERGNIKKGNNQKHEREEILSHVQGIGCPWPYQGAKVLQSPATGDRPCPKKRTMMRQLEANRGQSKVDVPPSLCCLLAADSLRWECARGSPGILDGEALGANGFLIDCP